MLSGMPWLMAGGEDEDLEGRSGLEAVGVAVLLGDDVVEVGLAGRLVLAHRARLREGAYVAGAGLDHRQAADGLVGGVDVGATASSAAFCMSRSMVVWIVRPPFLSAVRRSLGVSPSAGSLSSQLTT